MASPQLVPNDELTPQPIADEASKQTETYTDLPRIDSLGRESMESLAAAVAFSGGTFAEAMGRLRDHYSQVTNRLNHKLGSETAYLTDQRDRSASDLQEVETSLDADQESIKGLDKDLRQFQDDYCGLNANLRTAIYDIRQAQLQSPAEDHSRHSALVDEFTKSTLARFRAESDLRNGAREIALEAAVKDWERNAEEYRRRADELSLEQDRIQEQSATLETYLSALQRYGVTRNVSGFLFWTGSLTIAAGTTLLTNLVDKHDKTQNTIDLIINNIRGLIVPSGGTVTFWSILAGLAPVALIVALLMGIAMLLTWLAERFGRPAQSRRKPKRTKTSAQPPRLGALAFVWPFSLFHRELVTSSVENLTLRVFLRNLPGLILIPLGACLLIALTPSGTELDSGNTAVAVAALLSFQAISLIYATFVLGPRLKRAIDQADDSLSDFAPRTGKLVLFLTAIGGLIGVALLGFPTVESDTVGWPLIPLSVFLLTGGFALPFSIVFRGLYKDHDFLQRRREWLRSQVADLRAKPTDIEIDDDSLDEQIKQWRSLTARMDHQHYLNTCQQFYDDWGTSTQLFGNPTIEPNGAGPTQFSPETFVTDRLEHPEPLLYYRRVEPSLLKAFNTAYSQRGTTGQRVRTLGDQINHLNEKVRQMEDRRDSLRASVQAYDVRFNVARQRYQDSLLQLQTNQFRDEVFLREAWAVAELGAQQLKPRVLSQTA